MEQSHKGSILSMSDRLKADLSLALCTALWGATFVVVQDALRDSSVLVFLVVRFGLAAILMGAIFRDDLRRSTRMELGAGALIGIVLFLGYLVQTNGLRFTTPAKAGFINGTAVVLVPVFLVVLLHKKVNPRVWVGVLAAFVGLYLLTVPANAAGIFALNRGDVLIFLAAVMWAVHILLIARFTKQHSVGALSTVQVAVTALFAAVCIPIFSRAGWEAVHLEWTGGFIWRLLVTAVGCTAVGFSVQVWAQRHTTPTHVAILLTLEPVFAWLTSYLALGERLDARGWTGAVLILAGILLAELMGAQAAPESPGPVDEAAGGD
jgi:drug/metabolite transporter (DMT)-like permease